MTRNIFSSMRTPVALLSGFWALGLLGTCGCTPDVQVLQKASDHISGTGGHAAASEAGASSGGSRGGQGASGETGNTTPTPDGAATTPQETGPVDLYVMVDQSSSMGTSVGGSTDTWWSEMVDGIRSFVNDPDAAGAAVGIQYFPLMGIAPASCDAPYDVPEVEIAPLPGNASALTSSLAAHSPMAFTPTAPALQGAINHMKDWGAAHPERTPVIALVTDGYPTECSPATLDGLEAIAASGTAPSPVVRTFIVALADEGSLDGLNLIAAAGGTDHATQINGDVAASVARVLTDIAEGRDVPDGG